MYCTILVCVLVISSSLAAVSNKNDYDQLSNYDIADNLIDIDESSKPQCPPHFTGRTAHPWDCEQYVTCVHGQAHVKNCPSGNLFNPLTNQCGHPSKAKCHEGIDLIRTRRHAPPRVAASRSQRQQTVQCDPGASGLFAHPYDCAKFLNCDHGRTFVQDCGPGTMFNDLIKVCDWPHNVDCNSRGPGAHIDNELQTEDIRAESPYIYPMDVRSSFDAHLLPSPESRSHRQYKSPIASSHAHGTHDTHPFISSTNQFPYQQHPSIPLLPQSTVDLLEVPVPNSAYGESTLIPVFRPPFHADNIDVNRLDDGGYSPPSYTDNSYNNQRRTGRIDEHFGAANNGPSNRHHTLTNRNEFIATTTAQSPRQSTTTQRPGNRNNLQDQYPQLNYLSRRVVTEFDKVYANSQHVTTTPSPSTTQRAYTTTTSSATTRKTTPQPTRVQMVYPYGFEEVGRKCEEAGFDSHPHPFDCTRYMTCENGHMRMHSCKPGFMFNAALRVCDYTRNVAKCQFTPHSSPTTPRTIDDEINEIQDSNKREKAFDSKAVGDLYPAKPSIDLLPPVQPSNLPTIKPFIHPTTTSTESSPSLKRAYFKPDISVLPLSTDSRPAHPEDNQSNQKKKINQSSGSDTTPETLDDLDKQIEGIKTRIAVEENITIEANKPVMQIPRGKEHIMPIYQRPSRKLDSTTTKASSTTTTTTQKPSSILYEPFSHPKNDIEQQNDYMPINEALKLLFHPYSTHGVNNSRKDAENPELAPAHINNIEHKLIDIMDNGNNVKVAHQPLEQDSLAAAEWNDRNVDGITVKPTSKSRYLMDVEELTTETNRLNGNPPVHSYNHHGQHNHHNNHWNNHHHPSGHDHEQSPSNLHTRLEDVENILTNPNTDQITFPGSTNKHHSSTSPTTTNKHATHPGHHLNQGPNYRSNAPPENIDALHAQHHKDTTLKEEGFLCQFDCHNGKCITFSQLCDGKNDCGNRYDEQSCPHVHYQVRLSNENGKKHMGRVEVRAFGKWGYVCDDQFTITEANVLCRELGFNMGAAEVKTKSFYPPNANMRNAQSMFMMDNVRCSGNETSLKDCDFDGWSVSDCSASDVVGVVCKTTIMQCPANHWLCQESEECIPWNFMCDNIKDCTDGSDESEMHCNAKVEYRLMGGREMEGRVEVKYRGMWGTVCDDDFGPQEASVICKSLGFHGPATVMENKYGPGTGPIWLDQVSCSGSESSIDKCMHNEWSETNCNHTEDVVVRCSYGPDGKSGKYIADGMELQRLTQREASDYSRALDLSSETVPDFSNSCGLVKVTAVDESEEKFERFRVIGGSKAKRGHHPWQATIRTRTKFGSMHWCGAVIISEKHILTAAHCLVGFPTGAYVVRVGDHHSDIYEKSEAESFIEKWFIHEDFRKYQRMNNDIALIQLKQPIQFTNYIQPICLPEKGTPYETGRNCTISGWGTIQYGKSTPSNDLKAATVPLIAQEICRQSRFYGDEILDTMFCAGYLNKTGIDACDGDSGGPLVCADELGVHSLYGVISWGQRCGDATKPGVYVKITKYLDWIKEKMALLH